MKVPKLALPGDAWVTENQEELRVFLTAYAVDINDVYRIDFWKTRMTVYRYSRDSNGHRYISGDEVAKEPSKTFRYRGGLTPDVV